MLTTRELALPNDAEQLPDNKCWTNRIQIKSETSNRLYIVAQNKSGRFWSCSCFGFLRHKHCKHLTTMKLPGNYKPFEVKKLSGK